MEDDAGTVNIDLHIGSGSSCTLLPFNHCLLSVEMQERLRVLMLYHLCSLLLMCLELVVGFIKAPATTAAMQTIVKQRAGATCCTFNTQHISKRFSLLHLRAVKSSRCYRSFIIERSYCQSLGIRASSAPW